MPEEIAIAGFGGQGVLFIGRLLAEAGLREGHEVLWVPSYSAAKRGGIVWCNVIISDEKIGAMFVTRPTAAIAMNPPSLTKFEPAMKPGSFLVVNQSLVPSKVSRQDIRVVYVPANDLATELGDDSVGNLVALGALVAGCPVVSRDNIMAVLDIILPDKPGQRDMNQRAFNNGYVRAQESQARHPPATKVKEDVHVSPEDTE